MCRGRGGKCGDVWLDVRRRPMTWVTPHTSHHVRRHTVHTAIVKGVHILMAPIHLLVVD